MCDLPDIQNRILEQDPIVFVVSVAASLVASAIVWFVKWLGGYFADGGSSSELLDKMGKVDCSSIELMPLFGKCGVRAGLREAAYHHAGKPRNRTIYQVYCACASAISSLLLMLFATFVGGYINSVLVLAIAVLSMGVYLNSYVFLAAMLLGAETRRDIKRVFSERKYKSKSKRESRFLELQSLERTVSNYSHCLVVNAGGWSNELDGSTFKARYASGTLSPFSLISDIEEDTVILVYSKYGKESCILAGVFSKYCSNVYDLGGIAYKLDYYDRAFRAIGYQEDLGLLSEKKLIGE